MEVVYMRLVLSSSWRHSKLHKDVVQMLTVPMPATLSFLSQPAPTGITSQGVSYNQLTEEVKTQAWITDSTAWYAGTTWKWTAVTLQPLSGRSPKDSGEEKSSLWVELQAVY